MVEAIEGSITDNLDKHARILIHTHVIYLSLEHNDLKLTL